MAHVHEKIDFTASAFVVCRDKVLLRKHEKYHVWISVGGHIELDEDPNEAVLREVKEEVGLDITLWDGGRKHNANNEHHRDLIPPIALNRHHVTPTHEHIDMIYFARSESDNVIPERIDDEWRWLTLDELDSFDLAPDVRFYARLALETLADPR